MVTITSNVSLILLIITLIKLDSLAGHSSEPSLNQPLIENLDDLEAISYFLIHYYNHYNVKNENKSLSESDLLAFFENLKQGSHRIDHVQDSFDCDNEVESLRRFKKLDNSKLDKYKMENLCKAAKKCQSTQEMIRLINPNIINQTNELHYHQENGLKLSQSITKLCPIMLFQLHNSDCIGSREKEISDLAKPSQSSVWGFAILFVTIISFCSLVGVVIMPLLSKDSFQNMINFFEGLAVGSLIGSAIFHLIPQAFDLYNETSSHDYLWKALIIFGGIYLFFWSERLMKMVSDYKRRKKLASANERIDLDFPEVDNNLINQKHVYFAKMKGNNEAKSKEIKDELEKAPFNLDQSNDINGQSRNNLIVNKSRTRSHSDPLSRHSHSHFGELGNITGETSIATVAWMIVIGDGLHNFIDGLSIGMPKNILFYFPNYYYYHHTLL